MPTGYTSDVANGEMADVEDFILTCARAFGATIMQRDEPASERPKLVEPHTDYHDKALKNARDLLDRARGWTDEQADRLAADAYTSGMARWKESQAEKEATRARYETMAEKVRQWEPPTPDHVGLKDFMLKQLQESIEFDCGGDRYWGMPLTQSGESFRRNAIAGAERDITYHTEEREKEIARAADRNSWIQALYDSLPGVTSDA